MKLFISYARVDKPYCVQIAETLDGAHEYWYDQRLYVGQDWWKEILSHLDWCEGFIYLMSPESLASEYCQKEYRLAVTTGKLIFPVLIHPETNIPERLKQLQYADLSHGLTTEGVRMLLNSIILGERKLNAQAVRQQVVVARPATVADVPDSGVAPTGDIVATSDTASIIGEAAEAMENGKFDRAVLLLRQARSSGYISKFINIEKLLNEAEMALERQTRQRGLDREYQSIAELVKRRRTRKFGCEALAVFLTDTPDYDDKEKLIQLCATETQEMELVRVVPAILPRKPRISLPLLEWMDIYAGSVLVSEVGNTNDGTKPLRAAQHILHVPAFKLAKYPVTNAQYQFFLDDPDGYVNPKWWGYSQHAQTWRAAHPQSVASKYNGDERPRDNMTWYDAMAFCYWLGEKLDLPITLPTKQQWRRAAQGDDGRIYPWGNEFDTSLCNTRESRMRSTTLVMSYPGGVSPFGCYDMAGNVWEWCLNSDYNDYDITTDRQRAVQGGSFVGPHDRAQINFSFDLNPDYHYGSIGFRLALMTE
jgi:formylglycine-generating enzyme required for sulfatase activity